MRPRRHALLSLAIAVGACGSPQVTDLDAAPASPAGGGAPTPDPEPTPEPTPPLQTVFGGARPVTLHVPSGYDPAEPAPLLIVLHGLGATGAIQSAYLGTDGLVETQGVLLAAPDGTENFLGTHWNATDGCCGFGSGVDDAGYLSDLIRDVKGVYNVDAGRVFLVGHSNGGFMAYRMACDLADEVAAIVSLAGATWSDPAACEPSRPVSVLQIHGTIDDTIRYEGGSNFPGTSYPGAVATATQWSQHDGCAAGPLAGPASRDLDATLGGTETTVQRWTDCAGQTEIELWTIEGGEHIPDLAPDFAAQVWDWLDAHARP